MNQIDKICILIPTSLKYRAIAEFTEQCINAYWPEHPTIFFCGVPGINNYLQLEDSTDDWVGILYHACIRLSDIGYNMVYIILDDHPPLSDCNYEYLNTVLPQYLINQHAAYIGLNGIFQGRGSNGKILDNTPPIERTDREFKWKYSLHPALWRLAALETLLKKYIERTDGSPHTPWMFERTAAREIEGEISSELCDSYRIVGLRTSSSIVRVIIRYMEYLLIKLLSYLDQTLCQINVHSVMIDNIIQALTGYYEGPYPLYFSGVMKKGKINTSLVLYLKLHMRRKHLAKLTAASKSVEMLIYDT